jgi:hypothetical protein
MAGAKAGNFNELISPFLRKKILEAEQQFGAHSPEYRALTSQYIVSPEENRIYPWERRRHYEADMPRRPSPADSVATSLYVQHDRS